MKNRLFVLFAVCCFIFSFAQSQEKVVYKWVKDGMVNYGHIKPSGIKNFARLDGKGIKIKEISENFDEVVEIKRLPETARPNLTNINQEFSSKNDKQAENISVEELQKQKNCEISRENLERLSGDDPYMKDGSGDLFKLSEEQISQQKQQIEKDIAYYCSQ